MPIHALSSLPPAPEQVKRFVSEYKPDAPISKRASVWDQWVDRFIDSPEFKQNVRLLRDATREDQTIPGLGTVRVDAGEPSIRYIRVTATRLAERKGHYIFVLEEERDLIMAEMRSSELGSPNDFGRMPCSQGSLGRDHNPFVFTNWMCGGGLKHGTYGQSDEWGFKPQDRSDYTTVYDIHATILHQLGIDHKQLTVRNNGINRHLTDVHGHLLKDMLG